MSTPESVVQRQFEAYNAKDLSAWLATYAPDAEQYELHGARLAAGHAQMRERMVVGFTEPDLHAELLSRVIMGAVVVDTSASPATLRKAGARWKCFACMR